MIFLRLKNWWLRPAKVGNIIAWSIVYPFAMSFIYAVFYFRAGMNDHVSQPNIFILAAFLYLPPLIGFWKLPVVYKPKILPVSLIGVLYLVVMAYPVAIGWFFMSAVMFKAANGFIDLP